MNPVKHIRTNIFKLKQGPFAVAAGVSQATVSRWETTNLEPSRDDMDRIRNAAFERGLKWNDSLFFETPEQVAS